MSRLQSKRRIVPLESRQRALFSCDRCKLRKTKCKRVHSDELKYDNKTPCMQCSKAGVLCTTTIPRKKRFYGPVSNISLHYKCLVALVSGLFPDKDIYNIDDLINLGESLNFEMPSPEHDKDLVEGLEDLNHSDKDDEQLKKKMKFNPQTIAENSSPPDTKMKKEESPSIDSAINPMNNNKRNFSSSSSSSSSTLSTMPTTAPSSESAQLGKVETNATAPITSNVSLQAANNSATVESIMTANTNKKHISLSSDDLRIKEEEAKEALNLLPSSVNPRMTYDRERLLIDRGGHTHYIGSHGTASLLNGLCDIIIKRSYNQKKPPTSTQDLRDISVQTISSENEPVYQYPTHLYNLDLININKFPLINLLKRDEADSYTNVFFEKVHPYYFIFNQETFREKYELFWKEISDSKRSSESGPDNNNNNNSNANHARHDSAADGLTPLKLSPAEICSIYMVWILGRRFQQFSNPHELPRNSELNNELTARYIDIIKLSLSDIVLTPTIDGIRLIFLLSVYLSSIKVRESGWILMELACRQSMSLGLHRSLIINKFGSEKSQEMKRMIWSLIKAESTLCSSLGRPSALPLDEIDAELPSNDDVKDELFKVFYNQTCNLTKIIFVIMENKRKTQKEPLSLVNIEKTLVAQKKLETFWSNLPESWKDYKSLPVRRYKPKLHIQYHYYFVTLTLPIFLHFVNTPKYVIKKEDPVFSFLINGIRSAFKTAEILTYTDSNGFFNGTLYYDVFYAYNSIMILTLTYILFKTSKDRQHLNTDNSNSDPASNNNNHSSHDGNMIDLEFLDKEHQINLTTLLNAINLIRNLILNNLYKIDGTMKRMSFIIETILQDLGIIQILVQVYGAVPSNVRNIEEKGEAGKTSVGTAIPTNSFYYRRMRLGNLNSETKIRPGTKESRKSNSIKKSKKANLNAAAKSSSTADHALDADLKTLKSNQKLPSPKIEKTQHANQHQSRGSDIQAQQNMNYSLEANNVQLLNQKVSQDDRAKHADSVQRLQEFQFPQQVPQQPQQLPQQHSQQPQQLPQQQQQQQPQQQQQQQPQQQFQQQLQQYETPTTSSSTPMSNASESPSTRHFFGHTTNRSVDKDATVYYRQTPDITNPYVMNEGVTFMPDIRKSSQSSVETNPQNFKQNDLNRQQQQFMKQSQSQPPQSNVYHQLQNSHSVHSSAPNLNLNMNQERPIPPQQSLFSNNRSYNSLANLNNKSSTNLNTNFPNKTRNKSNVSLSSRSSITESNHDIYHDQDGQSINMPLNNDAGDIHNVNTVLNTMTIDTDLIDAIFGADNLYFSEENYY